MPYKPTELNIPYLIHWLGKIHQTLFFYRTRLLGKPYYPTLSPHFNEILKNMYLLSEQLKNIQKDENIQQTIKHREDTPF